MPMITKRWRVSTRFVRQTRGKAAGRVHANTVKGRTYLALAVC